MKRGFWVIVLFSFALAVPAGQAGATAILRLDVPGGLVDVTVLDGGVGDSNPLSGVITYNGSIPGSSWIVNVTTGITKPVIGSTTQPMLDLNSVNVSSKGPGSLQISFSEKGFVYTGGLGTAAGGTTNGSVNFLTLIGGVPFGNSELAFTTPVAFVGSAFSGSSGRSVDLSVNDWLSVIASINHPSGGVTSFDVAVPEPGTMMLLGTGLIGLLALKRKRIHK